MVNNRLFLLSLPSRERGLKFCRLLFVRLLALVAPLAGAWIEIVAENFVVAPISRRSPRGSVD